MSRITRPPPPDSWPTISLHFRMKRKIFNASRIHGYVLSSKLTSGVTMIFGFSSPSIRELLSRVQRREKQLLPLFVEIARCLQVLQSDFHGSTGRSPRKRAFTHSMATMESIFQYLRISITAFIVEVFKNNRRGILLQNEKCS